jgi:hypothetical protein
MAFSAFDDKAQEPQDEQLADVLGPSHELWTQLISEIGDQDEHVRSGA